MIGLTLLALLALPGPYLTKVIIDQAIGGRDPALLVRIILALFGVQGILVVASWATSYSFNRFSLEVMTSLKKDLYHRVLHFPMSFFTDYESGYLVSRVGEIEGLNLFFSSTLAHVLVSIARFAMSLIIMSHLNLALTGVALLILPPLFGLTRWFTRYIRRVSWNLLEKNAQISRGMIDSLSGIEVVKAFGAESREAEKLKVHLNDLKDMNVRRTALMSIYSECLSFLGAGTGFVILWISGAKIISGTFTLGSYIAFAAYFSQLLGPTQLMANLGLTLQPARIALQRISELLKVDAEDESEEVITISSVKGQIEFRDVEFWYEEGKPVFSKANMMISPGERIVLAGPNGSGKSTFVRLVMGFYRPKCGEILLDGWPLRQISKASLRERISIVSQNTFLFSDTVRNNVLFSSPQAASWELSEAIRLAGATDFIRDLPYGLDTEIGERGVRLSGGERQKLSIARAILRKSDIIIFDEATTHLDMASIALLRDLMQNHFVKKTCIVISHRPFEIPAIDHVFWIEGACIREVDASEMPGKVWD